MKRYIISIDKSSGWTREGVLKSLKRLDPKLTVDPEGNPIIAWIRTSITLERLRTHVGIDDALESCG